MASVMRQWEWRFAASPAALWRLVADTARFNEAMGVPRYSVTDIPQPDGSVKHIGSARRFGVTLSWEERIPRIIANRVFYHRRDFHSRLLRELTANIELDREPDGGTRVRYILVVDAVWPLAALVWLIGFWQFGRKLDRLFRELAKLAESKTEPSFPAQPPSISAGVRQRVTARARSLAERGYPVAERLGEHLLAASDGDVERMRPRRLARLWGAEPRAVIETCLAAVREGLLTLRWDLLCPRCRGAKVTVASLDQLPQGAHCPSCNIDYERDFTRNVEVTFEPAPAVRELGGGTYCLVSPIATEHIKVQRIVRPGVCEGIGVELEDGDYRVRTVEPGGSADFTIENGALPVLTLTDGDPLLSDRVSSGLTVCNFGREPRNVVIEDRRWAQDALTAHEATTMQAFRDLFAHAVLRPGDQVAIGRIALLFTDIKGSSDLYNRVGDALAYGLVREHYAVLTRAVREHDGAVVKTIGDAVMAAFAEPGNALDAALAIREGIARFNRDAAGKTGAADAVVVKLGLHAGPCIAVTLNDRLDYFGRTVNLAARLQGESRGADIVLSEAMAEESGVADRLAALAPSAETAQVKGFSEPVALRRIPPTA